ncbi:nuclease-related domain-containing protein [Geomicrobium sp. JCM 19039]|uniref:nuclease-related domain-containing protein n=1 Tax=Geomicrobium sp. JCM 19039 TaxID=1460636 RepID=UPI00045F1879|nr:nuclease-related domain-containing protein [Geomicrobium sp. JCM 19039]GAK14735.1 hypothetical protein JCM19039_4695 [Geomicrobium sp. JCM 19039]
MIESTKPMRTPEQVLLLRALLQRLHSKQGAYPLVFSDLKRAEAGYFGEKQAHYQLQSLRSDHQQYLILHNIRLLETNTAFQMDFIVLTQYYILILEVKHINGPVFFGEHDQFTRETEHLEIFANPLEQCLRQERLLKSFLNLHDIPIISRVVFTSNKTILSASEQLREIVYHRIIRSEALVSKIEHLNNIHRSEKLSIKNLYKTANILKANHTPAWLNTLNRYSLTFEMLQHGMYCETCLAYDLVRNQHKANWTCQKCNSINRRPYVRSLSDYAMLYNTTITNKEARDFLGITDRFYIRRALSKIAIQKKGIKKAAKYVLPLPIT